jgi:hypothetical protein
MSVVIVIVVVVLLERCRLPRERPVSMRAGVVVAVDSTAVPVENGIHPCRG